MSEADFDLLKLAEYMHLSPQQVERLASRGQLPGRRVGGQWRFSRADVHHWMEQRLGVLDEGELQIVEDRLRGREPAGISHSLADQLHLASVAVPLQARTKASVISEMCELAALSGSLWDAAKMAAAVRQREELHSTALENGVALLHPRRPLAAILEQPVLALGIASQGIPFGGPLLTDIFFLICSIDDRGHLLTLARLSRMITSPGFLDQLRATSDATEAHNLVVATDAAFTEPT